MTTRSQLLAAALLLSTAIATAPLPIAAQTILEEWNSVKVPPPPTAKPVTIDAKKTAMLLMDFNKPAAACPRNGRAAPKALPGLEEAACRRTQPWSGDRAHAVRYDHRRRHLARGRAARRRAGAQSRAQQVHLLDLVKSLKDKGVTTVILTGTSANSAVLFTAGGAAQNGFEIVVPVDAMPADTAYQEQFSVWNLANAANIREHTTLTKMDMIKF